MPPVERSLPSWLAVSSVPVDGALDGRECRTRAALFAEAARVLGFPPHFGRNWDAFYDCLRDANPSALAIAYADEILIDEPLAQLSTLLDVLADARLDVALASSRPEELRGRLLAALHPE